jgi:hypothetical protein
MSQHCTDSYCARLKTTDNGCRVPMPCLNNRLCCKPCLERFALLDWRVFVLMSVLLHKEGPRRLKVPVGVAEFVV